MRTEEYFIATESTLTHSDLPRTLKTWEQRWKQTLKSFWSEEQGRTPPPLPVSLSVLISSKNTQGSVCLLSYPVIK